jgi:hypothetical protein
MEHPEELLVVRPEHALLRSDGLIEELQILGQDDSIEMITIEREVQPFSMVCIWSAPSFAVQRNLMCF